MISSSLTCAEFFAGIGLVRLALERQGWRVVFANDIDPKKAEMYRRNWPDDAHSARGRRPRACGRRRARLLAGDRFLPLQRPLFGRPLGWAARKTFVGVLGPRPRASRDGRPPPETADDRERRRFPHQPRRARPGSGAAGPERTRLCGRRRAAQRGPLDAAEPARLFVLGNRDEVAQPRAYALACDARPETLLDFIHAHANIRWNLRDVPPLPRGASRLADVLEDLPEDDPHWWNEERTEYLMRQMSPRHAAAAREMIAGESISYATAFRRVRQGKSMAELRTDGIAGCLRTPRAAAGDRFYSGRARDGAACDC